MPIRLTTCYTCFPADSLEGVRMDAASAGQNPSVAGASCARRGQGSETNNVPKFVTKDLWNATGHPIRARKHQ
jgi:hypothetical protein